MTLIGELQTMLRCHRDIERLVFVFPSDTSTREAKKKVVADYRAVMARVVELLDVAILASSNKNGEAVAFSLLVKQTSVTFEELQSGAAFAILADVRHMLASQSRLVDEMFTRDKIKSQLEPKTEETEKARRRLELLTYARNACAPPPQ